MSSTASAPFDDASLPSGGVILRSSDGMEFKVYKNILALASPFFRDMFTLPRDNHGENEGESKSSDVEVIDVTETSSTLQILLRFIHPVARPVFSGTESDGTIKDAKVFVDSVDLALTAALKYDMQVIVKHLLKRLIDAAENSLPDGSVVDDTLALRVFVLACRHGLKDEARDAVHASLKGRVVDNFIPELRNINAAQYFYMINHHTAAVRTAKEVVQLDHDLLPSPYKEWTQCSSCGQKSALSASEKKAALWWIKFSTDVNEIFSTSPRSTKIFSPAYIQALQPTTCKLVRSMGYIVTGSQHNRTEFPCDTALRNWGTISQYIRDLGDKLQQSIMKQSICVEEFQ